MVTFGLLVLGVYGQVDRDRLEDLNSVVHSFHSLILAVGGGLQCSPVGKKRRMNSVLTIVITTYLTCEGNDISLFTVLVFGLWS